MATTIKAINLQQQDNKQERKYPYTRHTGNLCDSILTDKASTTDTYSSQINKEKEKGVATSFSRWPTAGRWRRSCPVGTWTLSARPVRASEPARGRNRHQETRELHPVRKLHPKKRGRTALVRSFYNPRMHISRIQRPGGRSHARPLVGRKGGVYLSGSGHCTRGSAMVPKTKGLGRRFRRPFGVVLQQEEEEEEVEAMVGGCRKMAAV